VEMGCFDAEERGQRTLPMHPSIASSQNTTCPTVTSWQEGGGDGDDTVDDVPHPCSDASRVAVDVKLPATEVHSLRLARNGTVRTLEELHKSPSETEEEIDAMIHLE